MICGYIRIHQDFAHGWYNPPHDPRGSDFRTAVSAERRPVEPARRIRQHLRPAPLPPRRFEEATLLRVRRFATPRDTSGPRPRPSQNRRRPPPQLISSPRRVLSDLCVKIRASLTPLPWARVQLIPLVEEF